MPPQLVSTLFTEVRTALRTKRSATVYETDLMVVLYNRALGEIWSILVRLGAPVVFGYNHLVGDGAAQDFELPTDFRAFVDNGLTPRVPITATSDYARGRALTQVTFSDARIRVAPSGTGSPLYFALFVNSGLQYVRFSAIPPAGHYYDYAYLPVISKVAEGTISSTYTPWLGLCDELLARTLEEWCLQGLEFSISKHQLWRARAEADLAETLGLRGLHPRKTTPSCWGPGSQ